MSVFAGSGAVPRAESALEHAVGLLESYLVTGKFLALFSLLFGLSFGLYLERCRERGVPAAGPYARRLLALLLIGAAHRVLGGTDILMTYAVLGCVLLLFRRASNRTLLAAAVLALALPELWREAERWIGYQPPPPLVSRAERMRLAVEGPWLELVRVRARMLPRWWLEFLRQGTAGLPLFLLGLWTARSELLARPLEHRAMLRAICTGGLILTAAGFVAQSLLRPMLAGSGWETHAAFGVAWTVTTFAQAIFYGTAFALLWAGGSRAARLLARLVPAGRMALTNYLAVSLIVTAVVTLGGWWGRYGIVPTAAAGLGLWLLEVLWSTWWLRRHSMGPAEWGWRRMAGRPRPVARVEESSAKARA